MTRNWFEQLEVRGKRLFLHFDRDSRFFPIGPREYKAVAGLVTNLGITKLGASLMQAKIQRKDLELQGLKSIER